MEGRKDRVKSLEDRLPDLEKRLDRLEDLLYPRPGKPDPRILRMGLLENLPMVLIIIILAWLAADKIYSLLS